MRIVLAATLAAAVAVSFSAEANPTIKTVLPCKFGQAMDVDHMLDIQNTTKTPLGTEAIINLDIKTNTNGETYDCFALTSPLAAGAHISHLEKITVGGAPTVCKAFISGKYPAIQHGSDGSSSTQCDY
jgi:hypothetical protein